MSYAKLLAAVAAVSALSAATVVAQAPAPAPAPAAAPMLVPPGPNGINFPEKYAEGVLYTIVDRPDNKQYRELYVTPASALDAAKKGEPLPRGTVLTLVQYKAVLDEQGNPKKDANGRFMKGDLIGYAVMEKREGWGAKIPEQIRNGEWEYQSFTAARAVNDKANLGACFACHKPLDKQDFVFSYEPMKNFKR